MTDKKTRMNERILARIVTVIDADGNKRGDFLKADAINLAKDEGMDLVQVSPDLEKPVCKIMDYGKWKYEQKKKRRQNQSSVVKIKEVKLRLGIDEHDLETKLGQAKKFLSKGHKVKMTVKFEGRQFNLVKDYCLSVASRLDDISTIEVQPKHRGNTFFTILRPE